VAVSELEHSEGELRLILAHDMHVSATTRNIALNAIDLARNKRAMQWFQGKRFMALPIQSAS